MKLRSYDTRSDFFRRSVFVALGLLGLIVLAGSLSGQLLRVQTATPQQVTISQGTLNTSALTPGQHNIIFEGKDAAGNMVNLQQTFTVAEITAPTVSPTNLAATPVPGGDKIAVLYTSGAWSSLTLARYQSGQWQKETLPFGGLHAALAVDSQGNFHVSYATTKMMYANNASGSWQTQVVNPTEASNGYSQNEITVNASGVVEILYLDGNYQPWRATNNAGSWDNKSHSGWKPKELTQVDQQGNNHTLTVGNAVGFNQATLSYATNKSGSLVSTALFQENPTANCFPSGVGVAMAVDFTGKAHIAYPRAACLGGTDTWYATEGPNGLEQVVIPGATGNYPARKIVVDGQGTPYIAVVQNGSYIWQPRKVTIVSRSATGWQSYNLESRLTGSETYRVEGMVSF